MSHQQIAKLFSEAEEFLITARNHLNRKELVDLTGMEPVITELCKAIEELPQEEAKDYELPLQALGDALGAITIVLKEHRDGIQQQLKGLQQQANAQSAYAKPDSKGWSNE